jgi:hypothetical protein
VISSSDTDEERRRKLETIEARRKELESLKESKAEEIVTYLDLFGGQISLSDILNMPISLLRQLRQAKVKEKELLAKSRAINSRPTPAPAYVSKTNANASKGKK